MRRLTVLVVILAVTPACSCGSTSHPPGLSGTDAGAATDAASPTDAGTTTDSQTPADTAVADTGAPDAAIDPAIEAACESALDAQWKTTPPSTGVATTKSAASYDAVIGKLMSDYAVPGGAVAVVKNGKLVFAKGYGLGDVEAEEPAHADALFRVASLSKELTAFAVLSLVEAGKLSLDDHPFTILSELTPAPGDTKNAQLASITVRELLNHTGGWNRDSTFDPMFMSVAIATALSEPSPPPCADVIRYMLGKPLQYSPGTTYDYSNFGYCVLGRVIERKSGMAYADYVQTAVMQKAGVTDALIGHSLFSGRADEEVRYYDFAGAGLATNVFQPGGAQVPWPYGGFDLEAMDAHGAWVLSPIDLLRVQVVADNRPSPNDFLSAASFAALTADPKVATGNADGTSTPYVAGNAWYGFGFSINTAGNWWHTGSLPGTSTEVVRAQNGYGWAAFFNTRPGNADAFFTRLDGDLWTALNGANDDFLAGDLFASYPDFSSWMSAPDLATAAKASFPMHVEGRSNGGSLEYRARLGGKPPVSATDYATGLTCTQLKAKDASLPGYSHASLQWFADASGRRRYQVAYVKP